MSIKKKVCMLGAYAVGKTSLVRRFAYSIFSEKYHSTLGVKVDKKNVNVAGQEVELLLWDIAGEDDRFSVPMSYLKGSAGYLLVIDGTRRTTLGKALDLQERTQQSLGDIPFIVVINKTDLSHDWEILDSDISKLSGRDWTVLESSAKFGTGVEAAFSELAHRVMGKG
jgi:hypothetical protein